MVVFGYISFFLCETLKGQGYHKKLLSSDPGSRQTFTNPIRSEQGPLEPTGLSPSVHMRGKWALKPKPVNPKPLITP